LNRFHEPKEHDERIEDSFHNVTLLDCAPIGQMSNTSDTPLRIEFIC
jgi:hypothetical protein